MTIYILDNDSKKIADYLDDKSLDKMVQELAIVLCNAHCKYTQKPIYAVRADTLLPARRPNHKFAVWARECVANYKFLVELLRSCIDEYYFRLDSFPSHYSNLPKEVGFYNKYKSILEWARDNVPEHGGLMLCTADMPSSTYIDIITPFPLVMPENFRAFAYFNPNNWNASAHIDNVVFAYRNYYQAKIQYKIEKAYKKNSAIGLMKTGLKWTRREIPEWINS